MEAKGEVQSEICKIGFGSWQIGGEANFAGRVNGWGPVDDEESIRAVVYALENGINFFDTAVAYGNGKSEEILGKAFRLVPNQQPIICTKFGSYINEQGAAVQDFGETHLRKNIEESLKRLQKEHIDILLLHNPPTDFDWASFDASPYERCVEEGLIGTYGVSCRNLNAAMRVLEAGFGSVIEAIYNPLDRRAADEVLPLAKQKKVQFIARVPLCSGFLTPRSLQTKQSVFASTDIRSTFPEEQSQWLTDSARQLRFLDQEEGGISVSALRFQLANPHVTVAIPGMRKVAYVKDALKALELGGLAPALLDRIQKTIPLTFYKWR